MKILFLAGETGRTLCYLHNLAMLSDIDVEVILYGNTDKKIENFIFDNNTAEYLKSINVKIPFFSEKSYLTIIQINNWQVTALENKNINSEEISDLISTKKFDLIIFSGYGGDILKNDGFFRQDHKILHMHPGDIPAERGSTTLYYSILNQNELTVTSFFMTKEIDEGEIILKTKYPVPEKLVDIDSSVDPILRADCLMKSIENLQKKAIDSDQPISDPESKKNEEFFVIHPLLKHIALLSLNKQHGH